MLCRFAALNQAEVKFYKLYANPDRGDIRMSKNDTLPFSIGLYNPGDIPLTGFSAQFKAYRLEGTNQLPVTNVMGRAYIGTNFVVNPDQTQRINLELSRAKRRWPTKMKGGVHEAIAIATRRRISLCRARPQPAGSSATAATGRVRQC